MKAMRSLLLLAVCLCATGAQESPQAPDIPTPQTLLDVVARDKKGKPVLDLKTADLQILDEGTPAKIMGLRLVTATDAAGSGMEGDPLRRVRLVSLVFDKLDAEERHFARQAALDFLNDDFGQNVYMGVFVADPRLLLIQTYTNDRDLVRRAVEQAATAEYAELSAQSAAVRKKLEDSLQPKTAAGTAAAPAPGSVEAVLARIALSGLQSEEQLVRIKQWRSPVLALLSLIEEQARLPGRKTLLYFSDDLQVPESMTEALNTTIATANHAHVSVYGVPTRGWSSEDHSKKKLLKLHKGPAPGASSPPPVALEQLSNNTGGLLLAKTNDAKAAFRKVGEDIDAYYEVAYVPSNAGYDGRFRKVTVQVDVPEVKMQARSGYLALPPIRGTAFVYELPLLRALNANPAPNEFPFQAGALRLGPDGGKLEYGIVMEAPFRDVAFAEDRTKHSFRAHLSLLALVKDEHGLIAGRFSRDLPVEVPADKIEAFRRGSFSQTFRLRLAPGPYTLDAAAMDHESQKVSARKVVVAVPAARPDVNVSDLALVRRIEPETAATDVHDPFHFEGGEVVPALDNTIPASSSGELSYYVVVYPSASVADKPQLEMNFVKDGNSVGQASPELPAGKDGRIPYVATLPLANFGPGTYELHLTIKQGAAVAEQKATFTISP